MANFLNSLVKFSDPKQAGKALLWLNVFSTALAATTNTLAVATDKNTSPDDKKFLIPAGVMTGVANIGLYLALTLKCIGSMEKLAEKAIGGMLQKGTFKDSAADYTKRILEKAKNKEYLQDMQRFLPKTKTANAKEIAEFIGTEKIAKNAEMENFLKGFKNLLNDKKSTGKFQELLKNGITNSEMQYMETVKGCGSVLGAFIGVIVGYGILSPIIRDVSAYVVQKHMEKKNPKLKNVPYKPYFDPAHIKVGYASTKQPLNINTYMAFTRSRKIYPNDLLKV